MPSRIEDYALIGDCHSAALVGKDGSIDWLCWPRFDSGACFAALLGEPEHGRWLIAPALPTRRVSRRYLPLTLVIETLYETDTGEAAIIDFMPIRDESPRLIRIVEGRRGRVSMQLELMIRFDYGSIVPWVRSVERGISAIGGPDRVRLRCDVELKGQDYRTVAQFEVQAGQREAFDLAWHPAHESEPVEVDPFQARDETEAWWRDWTGRHLVAGEWADVVERSLITLKALAYAPTGGLVAAPTTSLPEREGGVRNWDYRICWLRDATFTLMALLHAGYLREATEWRQWLLRAVAGEPSKIQILYGLSGERRLHELELPWLPGYQGARPVRVGNGAAEQLQLDVYGEVLDSMHQALRHGMDHDEDGWRVARSLLKFLESNWDQPDEGIWEVRAGRRCFTHSRMMAWVAFDRGIKIAERFGLEGPLDRWRAVRDEIHAQVCREGFDPELGSFVQFYGSKRLDASLLLMPLVGFLPADDPRVRGTVEAIEKHLTVDGFVYRYAPDSEVDGLPPGEGAFLLCTFWLADCQSLLGRQADARQTFERLLSVRNDVGLLSELYDPHAKRLLGNFPQGFSHVGLVNTALNLAHGVSGPASSRGQS
ncbi:MAG: glycoside hydrolase family 15 protein [Isosphaeraceae bacterium]